ncbi:MAG: hypothetical protein K0S61_356 [Anaerocolumna sp.]|nr:hypothetical protein [Anaerocolumna sp.]
MEILTGDLKLDEACRKRIISEDYADFILRPGQIFEDMKRTMDVCHDNFSAESINVYTPVNQVPKNSIHLYGYGAYPNCYGLLDTDSLESSGIIKVRAIPNFNLRGNGILMGIIDTGIEYTHKSFIKEDGTTKVYTIWDQTIESDNLPEGFYYGTEYTQAEINAALQNSDPLTIVPSTDENGHGTYLAGIAVGTPDIDNQFAGVVPDAEIAVVKLKPAKKYLKHFWCIPEDIICYQKNDLMNGIKYLFEKAKSVDKPLSLFISLGTSQGGHDERGSLSSYLSYLAVQKNVCVSIAAGNEGNSGHHYMGSVLKGAKYDTVELKVGPKVSGFSMELWGTSLNLYSLDILSPTGEYIPRIPARLNESREIRFIFERTTITVDYQIVEAQSGDQLILMRFLTPTEGIWRFRVYANESLASSYHIWLPIRQFLSSETEFVTPNPYYTLTSPGNTFIPIVATAYNHMNNSLYESASRGYMRSDYIAPSLAAPGVNMVGPSLNNSYTTLSGSSISAAHAAGIGAILLEWGIIRRNFPQIGTVEIRNLLIRGAIRDPNLTYPNKEWGYGIMDLYNTFDTLRAENP